jgi:hypothetical protein
MDHSRSEQSTAIARTEHLRAGDADRDQTIAALSEAHVEGRLSAEEWNARLDRASVAATYGELDELTRDLPPTRPAVPTQRQAAYPRWRRVSGWFMTWSSWATVTSVLVLDDVLNAPGSPIETPFQYPISPWPLWIAVPYGIAVARRSTRNSLARGSEGFEIPRTVEAQGCER